MINENNFIIGIDLGNLTSTVSYFDFNQMGIDVVDIVVDMVKLVFQQLFLII